MLRAVHDDVLEQVAKTRLDRPLVAVIHLEVVGHRALLAHLAVGLGEHGSRGIAVACARSFELLERPETRLEAGHLLLAGPHRPGPPVVLDARAGQLGCSRRAGHAGGLERTLCAVQPLGGRRMVDGPPVRLHAKIVGLDQQF